MFRPLMILSILKTRFHSKLLIFLEFTLVLLFPVISITGNSGSLLAESKHKTSVRSIPTERSVAAAEGNPT